MKHYRPYFKHLKKVKAPFALGVLSGLVFAASSGLGLPLMIDVVFPMLFEEKSKDTWYSLWIEKSMGTLPKSRLLLIACLWIPLIFLIRGLASYANSYFIQYSGRRVLEEIRMDLFTKLQSLPLSFFRKNKSGDLLARIISDTEVLRTVIAGTASDLIKQPATLIGAFSFLAYKAVNDRSFFIAMIALVTVPICVSVIRAAGKKLAKRAAALQARGGDLTATLSETLQSPLEIRAYNLQQRQIERFHLQIKEMLRLSMKVVKYRQAISPSIEMVSALGFAIALYLGVREGMTQSSFLALGAALFMAYEPIKKIGAIHSMLKQGDASIARIDHIMHAPDNLPDPAAPLPFAPPKSSIRFENLSFAYIETPVLQDINLEIPIGQVVALVGPSGAGKSTFSTLIPRFYDPLTGCIRFDGEDIRAFRKKDLRGAIAIVPQMPSLFAGSIAENIRIGRLDASDEEVREAAHKANADEFILRQPQGYDTPVGERGDSLSGGQRQRIAIARAFLKDAPILILDEATSALDSESEAMVQQALTALVKGRTTFIIAHRFSTITIADRILVFQEGRIVADGTHEQLRESDSIYQSMIGSLPA